MKLFKKILRIIGIVLLPFVLVVLGYLSYVLIQYSRIEDYTNIEAENNQNANLTLNTEYTITTYNIGFGAYSKDYSFFMDLGTLKSGEATQGKYAKAFNKEDVLKNTNGAINVIKELNVDFAFFQEVDTKSNRSYKVNQCEMIKDSFNNYGSLFASNFHTAYLLYPFNDPIGKSNSGIITLSKYQVSSAVRRSFPLTGKILSDLTDLDRCFLVTRIKINDNKDLLLVNLHMSAYDEGGKVRAEQMKLLCSFLEEEKDNYVIVGGDFNHCLNDTEFESNELTPDWVAIFPKDDLPSGYTVVSSGNAATCRSSDLPYQKGVNYEVVIDGFIVGNGVEVISVTNIDTDYEYSDHNPVKMAFRLN